jgi:pimeloyl-ACP methyl ester carboxylesterase
VLLLLADGTHLPVTELPGDGPWTFLVLQAGPGDPDPPPDRERPAAATPDPVSAGPEPGGAARFLTRYGRAVVPELRGRPGFGESAGFLRLVDDLDQIRTRAGLGRPVLVGLGELAAVALRAAIDQPWAWRALVLAPTPGWSPGTGDLDELDLPVLLLAGPDPGETKAGGVGSARPEPDPRVGKGPARVGSAPPEPGPLVGKGPGGVAWVLLDPGPWEEQGPPAVAVQGMLDRLGGGPGWSGIAPDAPPR